MKTKFLKVCCEPNYRDVDITCRTCGVKFKFKENKLLYACLDSVLNCNRSPEETAASYLRDILLVKQDLSTDRLMEVVLV